MESSPISTALGCWFQVQTFSHKIIDKGLIQSFINILENLQSPHFKADSVIVHIALARILEVPMHPSDHILSNLN